MQTSKFAVFRTVCEIYLTNSSEPYIKLKPHILCQWSMLDGLMLFSGTG